MAAQIPDAKWLVLLDKYNFWLVQNTTDYHPEPVLPSTTYEALLDCFMLTTAHQVALFLETQISCLKRATELDP